MASINFDANQVEPASERGPLPAGKYTVAIVKSTMKPTKSGTGQYLELEYVVIAGPMEGRKLWSRHNLINPSQQAVEIARGELSSICRAAGVMVISDSAQLHDRPMVVTVKLQAAVGDGDPQNHITAWASGTTQTAGVVVADPAKPAGGAPWLRGAK